MNKIMTNIHCVNSQELCNIVKLIILHPVVFLARGFSTWHQLQFDRSLWHHQALDVHLKGHLAGK